MVTESIMRMNYPSWYSSLLESAREYTAAVRQRLSSDGDCNHFMPEAGRVNRIDQSAVPLSKGSGYPAPFDAPCRERVRQALGDSAKLTDFGVNLLLLPPGAWSSQRHWHSAEDEFIWVVQGEVVLVTDQHEEILRSGDCAGFKAGIADGHHLQNRSDRPAAILEVGSRRPATDLADYPDIDLRWTPSGFTHKDGTPY
jgi:uncharacterized cupin superfamily protein